MLPMNSTPVLVILRPTSGPKNLTVPLGRTVRPRSQRRYQDMRRDAFAPEVAKLSMTPLFHLCHWHALRVLPPDS